MWSTNVQTQVFKVLMSIRPSIALYLHKNMLILLVDMEVTLHPLISKHVVKPNCAFIALDSCVLVCPATLVFSCFDDDFLSPKDLAA